MESVGLASGGALQGQVAVVTGAGRGIGRAIALALAEAGAQVLAVARTRSDVDETAALISQAGGAARAASVDVTQQSPVEHFVRDAIASVERIDILVNCAGNFASLDPVWEVDPGSWWKDLSTNLFGAFLCCRFVLPGMIARRKGTIINLSGGGAGAPAPYWSGYASSKAGILRFTDSLAGEVAQFGIQVYALGPGLVRTVMTETLLQHPRVAEYAPWFPAALKSGRDVSPEAAGQLAVRLASLKAAELSGRAFSVGDDMDYIVSQSTMIAEGDFYTLRMRKPPTFERDLAGTSLEEGKTLIQRLFSEVVNRQMLDQLDDMVGAEFRLGPDGASGPDALRDLIRWLHSTFSDLEYDVEDLIAEGDRVVARTSAQGIHRGAYLGIAATGRRVSFTETFVFRISDRRIAEWWIDTNRIAILQQIGVTFTAPDS